jgi:hypothetical protein
MIDSKLFNKWKTDKFNYLINRLNEQKGDWPDFLHGLEKHREMVASELNSIDPSGQAPLILNRVNELRLESKKQKARPYEEIVFEILEQKGVHTDKILIKMVAERISFNEFLQENLAKSISALVPDQPAVSWGHPINKPFANSKDRRRRKDGKTILTSEQTALLFICLREAKVILSQAELTNDELAEALNTLTSYSNKPLRQAISTINSEYRKEDIIKLKEVLKIVNDRINGL